MSTFNKGLVIKILSLLWSVQLFCFIYSRIFEFIWTWSCIILGGWKKNQKWDYTSINIVLLWPNMMDNQYLDPVPDHSKTSSVSNREPLTNSCKAHIHWFISSRCLTSADSTESASSLTFVLSWKCWTNILNSMNEIIAESWLAYIHITSAAWIISYLQH